MSPPAIRPGVWEKVSQIDGPLPSASAHPRSGRRPLPRPTGIRQGTGAARQRSSATPFVGLLHIEINRFSVPWGARGWCDGPGPPARADTKDMMTHRTPSEQSWLPRHRHPEAATVTRCRSRPPRAYPPGLRVAGTPLLAPPGWRLPAPVPLDAVAPQVQPSGNSGPDVPDGGCAGPGGAACPVAGGTRYRRYSRPCGGPRGGRPPSSSTRPVYRLTWADLNGPAGPPADLRPRPFLRLRPTSGGAAGLFEYAAARLAGLPGLRLMVPTGPLSAVRPGSPGGWATLAVSALTLALRPGRGQRVVPAPPNARRARSATRAGSTR